MRNQKGITLVALVVTIIVLIILAGVSVALVVGDNGIITQAQRAEQETANATITSEEQMNALVNEINQNISESGDSGDTDVTVPINQLQPGDYIKYNSGTNGEILCRVLYTADSKYGFQIISDKNVGEKITLGAPTFEEARASYNGSIENFNNAAEKYINSEYATDARCVGSIPTVSNGVFTEKDSGAKTTVILPPSTWSSYTRPSGWTSDDTGCYDTDTNYTTDQTQMQKYKIWNTGEYYWIASRGTSSDTNLCRFYVCFASGGSLAINYILDISKSGEADGGLDSAYGLRPCILLRSDVQITGGDGTSPDKAYVIK